MARKFLKVQKFEAVNKATLKTPVKHTRTGACTAKGHCYHGKKM